MFKKSFYFLISTAFITMIAFARMEEIPVGNQMQTDNMGDANGQAMDQTGQYDDQAQGMSDNQSNNDLPSENTPNNDMGNNDQGMNDGQDLGDNQSQNSGDDQSQDDGQVQDMNDDQGQNHTDSDMINNDSQGTGPSVNVAVNSKVDQNYQTKASNQNIQYQLHLQLFEGSKDNGGSDAFRQDINIAGGDQFPATFDNYDKQPGQLLVAISKPGNKMQMFCLGKNMKDGRINGVPQQIEVTLETPKDYAMKNGDIKNNTYPRCTVTY